MTGSEQNQTQVQPGSLDLYNGSLWFIHDCSIQLDAEWRRIFLFLLYLLVFLVGLLENGLVVWVNWRRRHHADGVLFCVINVSLSDLMLVLILPFFMMEVALEKVWLWGRFLCKVTNLLYMINFYSTSFFLASMTLERYLALTRPSFPALFPVGGRRRWALCGALWAFSLVLALLENVHVDLLEWDEPGCYMMPEQNFTEWYVSVSFLCLLFQFLVPASVIVSCNLLIARAARTAPEVQDRRDLWLVHVYSLVFVLCWLPFHAVLFLMMVDDLNPFLLSCNMVEFLYFSFTVVQAVSFLHCVANPVLYNFLSKSFQSHLVSRVVDYLPREAVRAGGGGAELDKQRRSSEVSTSQSDVGS